MQTKWRKVVEISTVTMATIFVTNIVNLVLGPRTESLLSAKRKNYSHLSGQAVMSAVAERVNGRRRVYYPPSIASMLPG